MLERETMSADRWTEVITGVNHIWNNKFEEADALFASKKNSKKELQSLSLLFSEKKVQSQITTTKLIIHHFVK